MMKTDDRSSVGRMARFGRVAVGAFVTLMMATSIAAAADRDGKKQYDSKDAGHPLRIAAYVLHPVGVILDRFFLRPAYWMGSHEPIKTLVGRTD